jgi:very-short-patch-repair endonuclease
VALAATASGQRGVVTRHQLTTLGFSRRAVEHLIAHGRLHRVFKGVYLVGHAVMPALAREQAALLTCGQYAVLSHRSAAILWSLLPPEVGDVHITVPHERASRSGIRVHRSKPFDRRDVTSRRGIPVTAPARTLLDFAETSTPRELERAFDEAMTQRLVGPTKLAQILARSPGRHGAAALNALMKREGGSTLTRLEAEEIMLRLIRAASLPAPHVNATIGPYEVDFYWPEYRLVVELDSYRFHSSRAKLEHDRRKEADLKLHHRLRVDRVTFHQLDSTPEAVVARLAVAIYAAAA